jgi:hypothetical protein
MGPMPRPGQSSLCEHTLRLAPKTLLHMSNTLCDVLHALMANATQNERREDPRNQLLGLCGLENRILRHNYRAASATKRQLQFIVKRPMAYSGQED